MTHPGVNMTEKPSSLNGQKITEKIGDKVTIYLRGKTWYVNYQVDGKQRRESLHTSNKKNAFSLARQIELRLQEGLGHKPIKQIPFREVIAKYIQNAKAENLAL